MTEYAPTLLVLLLALPVIGAAVVAALGPHRGDAVRTVSLATVLAALVVTALVVLPAAAELHRRTDAGAVTFKPLYDDTRFDLVTLGTGTNPAAIRFHVGLDGLNIWLVALTSVLMVPSVLVSWTAVTERVNEFYAWLLALQSAMTGVFLAFDVILFYVFFELTLVPLFFLIGIWGGPMRREAARKFFLYTLLGSLITLLGVIGVILFCYNRVNTNDLTFSIPTLVERIQETLGNPASRRFYGLEVQGLIFLALAVGFAVKVPLFPVHTWLPLAHVEAPTAGSVLLAGVLLKLGTYGFLRLCLPLTPDACLAYGVPVLGTLAAVGIVYGAFCAFTQRDVKKLVAYSSVSHMGFAVLGLFALNAAGITGGLLQMVNHGLSTGALFLLVGMLYERYHTRMIPDYGGMAARLKLMGLFWVFICLTSVGIPGLNGFVGEMLVLAGVYDLPRESGVSGFTFAVVIAAGIVLGAWYLFTMLKNVFFGPLHEPHHDGPAVEDLNGRELAALLPIAALCVFLGLWPQPVIDATRADVNLVARMVGQARDRAAEAALAAQPGPAVAQRPEE
jgi:NADH-quinone oxidoreductase subunit M